MKRSFTFVVLAAMLLICMTSCAKDESDLPEGMLLAENEAVDYQLYYPEDWQLDRNDGMISVYVSDKDRSNVSVTAFTASDDVASVDDYLSMGETTYFDYVKETFSDLDIITDGEEITLSGVPARQYVFTATVAGDLYKFRQIIAYYYGEVYMLTYTSTAEGFDNHSEEVGKIISEVRFT